MSLDDYLLPCIFLFAGWLCSTCAAHLPRHSALIFSHFGGVSRLGSLPTLLPHFREIRTIRAGPGSQVRTYWFVPPLCRHVRPSCRNAVEISKNFNRPWKRVHLLRDKPCDNILKSQFPSTATIQPLQAKMRVSEMFSKLFAMVPGRFWTTRSCQHVSYIRAIADLRCCLLRLLHKLCVCQAWSRVGCVVLLSS